MTISLLRKLLFAAIFSVLPYYDVHAQLHRGAKCGLPAILDKKPALRQLQTLQIHPQAVKNTDVDYSVQHPIPVIFHFVLTQAQINRLGGERGIETRVQTQIEAINEDLNRANSDSILIPPAFRPLYANANIRFGLARTSPAGQPATGYEIRVVNTEGIELYSNYASGVGFTESKYAAAGGLDAWDPTAYLNVWVINPLENNQPSRLGGLTIPPSFVSRQYDIPVEELGIMLHYGAIGKRQQLTDYYIADAVKGRTLTHELGHFFGLWHIWGDDEGACPGDANGNDDGIGDTPPQADNTFGSPRFPLYDKCSSTGNGIMFMNFMDYTDDRAKYMFTHGQAAFMNNAIRAGSILYPLTRQPQLLVPPSAAAFTTTIYPNPATDYFHIFFGIIPEGLKGIALYDMTGRRLYDVKTEGNPYSYYRINTGSFSPGVYMLHLVYSDRSEVKRIAIFR